MTLTRNEIEHMRREPAGYLEIIDPHEFQALCDTALRVHELTVAATQASFCLRTLLPDDPDAQMTVRMIDRALASPKGEQQTHTGDERQPKMDYAKVKQYCESMGIDLAQALSGTPTEQKNAMEQDYIQQLRAQRDNLAMMIRRGAWLCKKQIGDTGQKVWAGQATDLLRSYGLEGSPLRVDASPKGEQQTHTGDKP